MRKPRLSQRAHWADLGARVDEEMNQKRQFDATFIGPPKPRRKSGIELGLEMLMTTGNRIRAEERHAVLQELQEAASERARQRSYLRRLTEYADHTRALQLAPTIQAAHQVDKAIAIADLFEHEGRHYEVRTIDRWLSRPGWRPPIDIAPT